MSVERLKVLSRMARIPGNCALPFSSMLRIRFGNSSNGRLRSIFAFSAASERAVTMLAELPPGPRAPSSKGLDGSAITLRGSKIQVLPTPLQVSQAPYGLLKENDRGSSWGMLVPSLGQASFSE